MAIRLKTLHSPDLGRDQTPWDPTDCKILVQATVGPESVDGGDTFDFVAITPAALARSGVLWGRGLLVMPAFSWGEVERILARLIATASRSTWPESARELNKTLLWEFDGYEPDASAI